MVKGASEIHCNKISPKSKNIIHLHAIHKILIRYHHILFLYQVFSFGVYFTLKAYLNLDAKFSLEILDMFRFYTNYNRNVDLQAQGGPIMCESFR